MKNRKLATLLASTCLLPSALSGPVHAAQAQLQIDANDIAGIVTSAKGAEAGVWVIAESIDLPTKFSRTVVTDDQGRYVVPDLPAARYKIWVRGYGLVDSKPVNAALGKNINLTAVVAPTPAAAAQYYPPVYWASMIRPPAKNEFPGTGPKGNGINPKFRTQQDWMQLMSEGCMVCHQIGDKSTRTLAATGNSIEAWDHRIQVNREGDLGLPPEDRKVRLSIMNNYMTLYGRQRALGMFADWTDRIAKGEVPPTPPRPQGIERNLVVTVRDIGGTNFIHDHVSSSRQNAAVNAKGPYYGIGAYHSSLEVIDPLTNLTKSVRLTGPKGDDDMSPVHPHHVQMDDEGRIWMAGGSSVKAPAYCSDGSTPYSKYYPLGGPNSGYIDPRLNRVGESVPVYDPKTGKTEHVPICKGSNHISLGWDKDQSAFLSTSASFSWVKTKVWEKTHDAAQAHGWCPLVVDTNGDGKIDPDRTKWNMWDQPIDPKKDTLFFPNAGGTTATFASADDGVTAVAPGSTAIGPGSIYGVHVDPNGIVWGGVNFRAYIVRLDLGANPPETCKGEVYMPPKDANGEYLAFGARAAAGDSESVAWVAFSTGQLGKFDRRKCKVVNGPTATGAHCPEGWTIYPLPGPKMAGTNRAYNEAYMVPPDINNVMGLGKNAVYMSTINSDSIIAFEPATEKFYNLTVPYPMGLYPRDTMYRIDDPKTGWKGRILTASFNEQPPWHQEEGEGSRPKVAEIQIRPSPLAH